MAVRSTSVFLDYNRRIRYKSWEVGYAKQFAVVFNALQKLESRTKKEEASVPDTVETKLNQVEEKVQKLKIDVDNYQSEHKQEAFYHIRESKTELFLELDGIDIQNSKHRENRRQLMRRLGALQSDLESKIHKEHENCLTCDQRKTL